MRIQVLTRCMKDGNEAQASISGMLRKVDAPTVYTLHYPHLDIPIKCHEDRYFVQHREDADHCYQQETHHLPRGVLSAQGDPPHVPALDFSPCPTQSAEQQTLALAWLLESYLLCEGELWKTTEEHLWKIDCFGTRPGLYLISVLLDPHGYQGKNQYPLDQYEEALKETQRLGGRIETCITATVHRPDLLLFNRRKHLNSTS